MNLLIKVHPTRFAFMMSLVVLIAWILYYFVDVKLTNYNTRPVKAQLRQIVDVTKRHLLLFPGILFTRCRNCCPSSYITNICY